MSLKRALLLLFLVHSAVGMLPQLYQVHKKFEYKHTFKGPHMTNSKGDIPFWEHGGSAITSDEYIRVCPSVKSRKGWVWSKNAFSSDNWMVDVTTRITGRLKNGADGMAIWLTEQKDYEGTVYGNSEVWKGMAVVMDSFDNDGLQDNPRIQVVLNDGTRAYQHHTDGKNVESGGCVKDFRNRPYPVKLRIIYLRGVLEVWVHEGISLTEDDYELCAKLDNLPELSSIPKQGFWGVTAATGGLSDDHDVLAFITHSLTPLETRAQQDQKKVDQAKLDEMANQYSKMAEDFDRRKDTYQQEHHKDSSVDWQKEVEMEQSMRLVADMQVALQREIRAVAQKVDLLITGGGAGVDRMRSGDAVSASLASELSHIKTTESNILHQLADLRAAMDRTVPDGGKATVSEQLQPVYETKALVVQQTQSIDSVLAQMKHLAANKCPTVSDSTPSCLTPWLFLVAIAIQLFLMLGYSIYRQAQERNAKKFF